MADLDFRMLDTLEKYLQALGISYKRMPCYDGEKIVLTDDVYKACDFALNSATEGHEQGLLEWYGRIYSTGRDIVGFLTPTMCIIQIYHIKQYGYGYTSNTALLKPQYCEKDALIGLKDALIKVEAL